MFVYISNISAVRLSCLGIKSYSLKRLLWKLFSCGLMVTFPWIGDILQVTEFIQIYTNETLTIAQFYFLTKPR